MKAKCCREESFFFVFKMEQLKDVEDNEDEKSSDVEYTAPKKRGKNLNYVIMDDDLLPSCETIEDALEYFDLKYMRDNNFTWTTNVKSSVKTIHNLKCTIRGCPWLSRIVLDNRDKNHP
jgi:hypothetical protein